MMHGQKNIKLLLRLFVLLQGSLTYRCHHLPLPLNIGTSSEVDMTLT